MTYLNLISGPRNISTALMYSFAQRNDTLVIDEPFYACYLSQTNIDHPGKKEILAAQGSDEKQIKREIFKKHHKPVVFIKNMAHHIEVISDDFLTKCFNIFLIRDPKEIIASYSKVIERPIMRDIGIEYEYRLFKKAGYTNSIVIDAGLVLENPKSILEQICNRAGLGFDDKMLKWITGPKEYDGVWAPYWYSNVHQSTGFNSPLSSEKLLPKYLDSLYEEANVYYKKLFKYALKP